MSATPAELPTDLPDLTGLALTDLDALDDTALGQALRRILADVTRPDDAVAGFQSAI